MQAPARPQIGLHAIETSGGRAATPAQQEPQTPNSAFLRSASGVAAAVHMRPPQGMQSGPGRILNQPSRNGPTAAPASPGQLHKLSSVPDSDSPMSGLPPDAGPGGAAFFSARALSKNVDETAGPLPLPAGNLAAFDLHTESPSIRKTPGVDHNRSKPLNRELKHVPGSTQATAVAGPPIRTNIVNPQLDATRRIGAPGSPSPMANRGMYKPPTMKRSSDGACNTARAPLGDIPANGSGPIADGGNDLKRQRLSGT